MNRILSHRSQAVRGLKFPDDYAHEKVGWVASLTGGAWIEIATISDTLYIGGVASLTGGAWIEIL